MYCILTEGGAMVIQREQYVQTLLKFKDTEFIKIITGVRRSGKSYIMHMFQERLLSTGIPEADIITLNFEHPDNRLLLASDALYSWIQPRLTGDRKFYLFFDEIQEVDGWQKVINGLRVAYGCDIYITGSNAKLLSGELATQLSGRYIEIPVLPLSFKEYLEFKQCGDSGKEEQLFKDYMHTGAFPSIALLEDPELIAIVLQGIFDSIILKDVSIRGGIKDTALLFRIIQFLFDAAGNPVSAHSIANTLTSAGRKTSNETVDKYLELLVDAFIFYKVDRYDIRGKERLRTQCKYYPVDPGLRNCINSQTGGNYGQQLENIVFLELLRRNYAVCTGKLNTTKIDFVCTKPSKTLYVQVAYTLPENSNRETANLLHIPDNHRKIIITANRMDTGETDGIPCVHIIDFLLDPHW